VTGWSAQPAKPPGNDGCALCPASVKPGGLKYALDAGRQSSHNAARPTSHISTEKIPLAPGPPTPIRNPGGPKTLVRFSVVRPNSTVDRMRAQFRPRPFARAIHSHSAVMISRVTVTTMMMTALCSLTWAAVRLARCGQRTACMPWTPR